MSAKFTDFFGISVRIPAKNPEEAYTLLANAIGSIPGVDWNTHTYTTDDCDAEKDTNHLIPGLIPHTKT